MNRNRRTFAPAWPLTLGAIALGACGLLALSQTNGAGKNATGIEFVKIAPGDFMMGCSEGDSQCNADEKPVHRVQITKAFEMGKYEVTQAQWRSVMNTDPSTMHGDNRPVETISRTDAEEFLNKLNGQNDGYRYRLPTEAEWEYAARAGSTGAYAGPLSDIAWYSENSEDETHPVGMKKPNAWGLYDMEGNVREWVSDTYGANYYSNSPAVDPTGPTAGQGGRGGRGGRGGPGGPPPDGRGGPRGGPRGGRGGRGGPPPDGPPPDDLAQAGPPPDGFPDGPPPDGPPPNGFPDGPPPRGGGPRGLDGRGGPGGPGGRGGPGGPGGNLPVMRGGGWDNRESFVRVSSRYNYYGPTLRVSDVGFRVVRERITN